VNAPGNVTVANVLEYNAEGHPLRARNAINVENRAVFDELGRRTSLREAVGSVDGQGASLEAETRFAYDLEGRLVEKTDALGRKTHAHYDVLGRLTEVRSPLGRSTSFFYDEVGNRTRVESPTGEQVHFEYDARGRVTRRWSEGGGPTLAIDDTYAYDGLGRMTLARTASGITRFFEYDALDRVVAMHDPAIGTVRQAFDADGRVVQIGYPDGTSVHYGYSARGEVTFVRDPAVASLATPLGDWQLAYDALGRPVRERDPFGVERLTTYVEKGFVERVELRSATALVESYDYSNYDNLGNPGRIVSNAGTTTETTEVQYDARARVEKVAYPGGSLAACLTTCERFQYDKAGNRTVHVENGITRRYVVDDDDRLVEIEDAQGATLATFTHDAAGRRTGRSDTGAGYAYDALGRLRSVQVGVFPTTLEYTATDERTLRTDVNGTARYLGEWYETFGATTRRMVHGPGIDNVLAQTSGTNQVRTLLRDGTANVVRTSLDGAVSNPRRWEAFGGMRSGQLAVERGFHGRPIEGATSGGLVNVRARHYDPETGRFLQPDPLGIAADQLYAYAANDPYRFWDPLGLRPGPLSASVLPIRSFNPIDSLSDAVERFSEWAEPNVPEQFALGALGGGTVAFGVSGFDFFIFGGLERRDGGLTVRAGYHLNPAIAGELDGRLLGFELDSDVGPLIGPGASFDDLLASDTMQFDVSAPLGSVKMFTGPDGLSDPRLWVISPTPGIGLGWSMGGHGDIADVWTIIPPREGSAERSR
jgi:RHS repeat-associated protein